MKDMMTTLLRRKETLPNTVEEHPSFVKHARQRAELGASLAAAQGDLARLTAERDRLAGDRQEAAVRAILEGGTAEAGAEGTLQEQIDQLSPDIERATARVGAVTEAARRLDTREAEIRAAVRIEMAEQIQAAGRVVIADLAKRLREAAAANAELARLERYGLVDLPVRSWPELFTDDVGAWGHRGPGKLASWLEQAEAAGLDG